MNCRDAAGWTPLHQAAWKRDGEVVQILLRTPGVDVEATGLFGLRAVHLAVSRHVSMTDEQSDNADVLEIIVLDGMADINAVSSSGDTPLMLESVLGYEDIVDFIVHVDGESYDDEQDLVDGFATPKPRSTHNLASFTSCFLLDLRPGLIKICLLRRQISSKRCQRQLLGCK